MSNRPMRQIEVLNILGKISRHEVKVEKTLWAERNCKLYDRDRIIPRRYMRSLIGAGLVQPHGLGWDGGEWVYRLTPLGEQLMNSWFWQ